MEEGNRHAYTQLISPRLKKNTFSKQIIFYKDETKAIEQLELDILNKMEFLKILHKRVDNAIYEVTRINSFLDEYKTINDINTV